MRVLCFALAVLFMALAFAETTGSHPVVWILVFGTMALLSVLAMFRIYFRMVPALMLLLSVVYLIAYFNVALNGFSNVPANQWWHQMHTRYAAYALLCLLVNATFLVAAIKAYRGFKRLHLGPAEG